MTRKVVKALVLAAFCLTTIQPTFAQQRSSRGLQGTNQGGTGVNYNLAGAAIFGNGSDGTVVISSGTTSLARDMQYANLTISGTGHLNNQNGWEIRVNGTLDLTACPAGGIFAAPDNNNVIYNPTAPSASGSTGGTAPGLIASRTAVPGSFSGSAGKSAGTGAGTAGTSSSGVNYQLGGRGGAAGAGGTSGANTGGASAAQPTSGNFGTNNVNRIDPNFNFYVPGGIILATTLVANAGSVGGSGAGDSANNGGASGASGSGGGAVRIWAGILNRGVSTAASCIAALGESAGTSAAAAGGTASGGGGSAGAGGGWILLVTGQKTGTIANNALDVSGGSGAAGGNGLSTGNGGDGGQGGGCGMIDEIDLATNAYVHPITRDTAGTVGGTHSTITGGTAGPGCVGTANL